MLRPPRSTRRGLAASAETLRRGGSFVRPISHERPRVSSATCQGEKALRYSRHVRSIAPELVAGASDNDPTNVGTAIAVGAATVYRLAWVAILVAPLLGTVQTIAAEVGTAAGNDIQSLARLRYGRFVSAVLLASIVPVNIVTIAADLLAGAAGIGQLTGFHSRWWSCRSDWLWSSCWWSAGTNMSCGSCDTSCWVSSRLESRPFSRGPQWSAVAAGSFVPRLPLRRTVVAGALALLGTDSTDTLRLRMGNDRTRRGRETIEGDRRRHLACGPAQLWEPDLRHSSYGSSSSLPRRQSGAIPTNSVSILTAARVLRPIAGSAASDLFAIGLVISALASLPVLLATTAFVVSGHFGWRRGLSDSPTCSPRFYGVVLMSMTAALLVSCLHVGVITMLVAASLIAGIGAPFGLVVLILLARIPKVMHARPISRRFPRLWWLVVVIVGALGVLYSV